VIGARHGELERSGAERHGRRAVLLATLGVRIDPAAERMAFETVLETGVPLIIANVVRLPPFGTSMILHGPDVAVLPHEDDRVAVRATADRAAAAGIETELLRVFTTRPARALAELVVEREVGLLVIGPDASRIRRRVLKRAVRALHETDCLVWIAPDGYLR
jgi:Universal stress protein family